MLQTSDIDKLSTYLITLPLEIDNYEDGYEYNNPVLTLVDAVLSINRNYNNFVKPRLEIIKTSGISSFDQLKDRLDEGAESFMEFWNYNHLERVDILKNLLSFYISFKKKNNLDNDIETLNLWAEQSSVESFKEWNIKGIGFTTYQYLRMLCGADTVKPDIHIFRVIEKALGRKLSTKDCVLLIERTSKEMNVSARSLDHAIWLYSSSKNGSKQLKF
jgi:hypothetical protein